MLSFPDTKHQLCARRSWEGLTERARCSPSGEGVHEAHRKLGAEQDSCRGSQ